MLETWESFKAGRAQYLGLLPFSIFVETYAF